MSTPQTEAYEILTTYVNLYNDGKKNSKLMKNLYQKMKTLKDDEKAQLLNLFDTKIVNKIQTRRGKILQGDAQAFHRQLHIELEEIP